MALIWFPRLRLAVVVRSFARVIIYTECALAARNVTAATSGIFRKFVFSLSLRTSSIIRELSSIRVFYRFGVSEACARS